MDDLVLYERSGVAARIVLNRPDKLNALSHALVDALRVALARAASDEQAKVVVIAGAGHAFSAGYDLSEEADDAIPTADAWHRVLERDVTATLDLWRLPKPTIGVVRGWCLAGGCELAMACDMVIASEDARFGEPEIRYGSGPVTLLMPFVIGHKRANELLFTGDVVDAQEARRIGLINQVVAAGELDAVVDRLIAKLAPTPAAVLRLTKLSLLRAWDAIGLSQAVSANLDLSAILNACDTAEQREFDTVVARDGLGAALRWRDGRYGAISA